MHDIALEAIIRLASGKPAETMYPCAANIFFSASLISLREPTNQLIMYVIPVPFGMYSENSTVRVSKATYKKSSSCMCTLCRHHLVHTAYSPKCCDVCTVDCRRSANYACTHMSTQSNLHTSWSQMPSISTLPARTGIRLWHRPFVWPDALEVLHYLPAL